MFCKKRLQMRNKNKSRRGDKMQKMKRSSKIWPQILQRHKRKLLHLLLKQQQR